LALGQPRFPDYNRVSAERGESILVSAPGITRQPPAEHRLDSLHRRTFRERPSATALRMIGASHSQTDPARRRLSAIRRAGWPRRRIAGSATGKASWRSVARSQDW